MPVRDHRNDRCYAASAQLDPARHRGCDSSSFIADFARAHEAAGFDMALVGYTSSSAEGFLVAMHAAARTERLSYLALIVLASWRPPCSRARSQPSTS